MDIVSADYLTVDDNHDAEGLQALGTMNDTDDAFLVYAISQMSGLKPAWLSVRNASEPQIASAPFSGRGVTGENCRRAQGHRRQHLWHLSVLHHAQ